LLNSYDFYLFNQFFCLLASYLSAFQDLLHENAAVLLRTSLHLLPGTAMLSLASYFFTLGIAKPQLGVLILHFSLICFGRAGARPSPGKETANPMFTPHTEPYSITPALRGEALDHIQSYWFLHNPALTGLL
jgi:hypothetical protein